MRTISTPPPAPPETHQKPLREDLLAAESAGPPAQHRNAEKRLPRGAEIKGFPSFPRWMPALPDQVLICVYMHFI